MAANVSWALVLLVESFCFLLRPQEARSKLLGPYRGCGLSWRCAKAGECGHKAAFPPPDSTRAKLCAQHELLPKCGQVALALPQQATFYPEISRKQIHGKDTCFFYLPRFSRSPNYNFRIHQRSRTLRPFPLRYQIHHKAVMQTQ